MILFTNSFTPFLDVQRLISDNNKYNNYCMFWFTKTYLYMEWTIFQIRSFRIEKLVSFRIKPEQKHALFCFVALLYCIVCESGALAWTHCEIFYLWIMCFLGSSSKLFCFNLSDFICIWIVQFTVHCIHVTYTGTQEKQIFLIFIEDVWCFFPKVKS